MRILSLDEMKVIVKNRGTKDYKNKPEDDLIRILSEPKTKRRLSKKKIEDMRKDVNKSRHIFSKSKIKQIRKSLYGIKNPKNLSKSKIKEIETNLLAFEKSFSKPKKYHDYDDNEYRGIRDVRSLFNQFDKDYYKPIKTIKIKKDSIKIQLTMSINFISHKDSSETCTMSGRKCVTCTKSDNIEIMMSSKTHEIIEEIFESLLQRYQEGLEESMTRSDFIPDSVDLLYYQLQEISLKRTGSSYIDSLK